MDDPEFVRAFEACTLPAEDFSHRAHVRLAWIYLREGTLLEALPRFVTSLQAYATNLGAATKYHATITWAYVFLIHERMQSAAAETFDDFAAANPDLFEAVLAEYYSPETLASPLARNVFVLPR